MNKMESFKSMVIEAGLNKLLNLSSRVTNEELINLLVWVKRFTRNKKYRETIDQAIKGIKEGHPWVELSKRIVREWHPNYRRLLVNIFVNSVFFGVNLREDFEQETGFLPPSVLVISPTMRCNLFCQGCYAYQYKKENDLSLEIVDRIITEAKEMGIYFYTISGGEPFFNKDLLKIYNKHNDAAFHIYTNGTLLDKDYINKLVDLGNVIPLISLEGSEEETDKRRGKGIYEKVMGVMDNLKSQGVPFGFSVTHTSLNTKTIISDSFIDLMIKKGAVIGWYFQYIPIGRDPDLNLMPSPEDRNLRRKAVLRWRNEKPIVVYDFWNDGHLTNGCIAGGRRYCHINNNGDVEPCVFTHFAVDNIKGKTLKEVLTSPFFKAIQNQQPFKDDTEKKPNLLRPCMIIDHPEKLRELVKQFNAYPTCEEAEEILDGNLALGLDSYSREWKKTSTPVWENNYQQYQEK